MAIFVTIALVCTAALSLSFLVFDDIDLGDALDFGDDGGAGWFSLRNLLLLGMGVGAGGAIALDNGFSTTSASFLGLGVGAVLYLLGIAVGALLLQQESNSLQTLDSYKGHTGIVVLAIANQFHVGEVQLGAHRVPARAPYPIPEGAAIRVVGPAGFTVVVRRLDDPNH
jgi:membrane protein implicated in regulation of membrane protease activity